MCFSLSDNVPAPPGPEEKRQADPEASQDQAIHMTEEPEAVEVNMDYGDLMSDPRAREDNLARAASFKQKRSAEEKKRLKKEKEKAEKKRQQLHQQSLQSQASSDVSTIAAATGNAKEVERLTKELAEIKEKLAAQTASKSKRTRVPSSSSSSSSSSSDPGLTPEEAKEKKRRKKKARRAEERKEAEAMRAILLRQVDAQTRAAQAQEQLAKQQQETTDKMGHMQEDEPDADDRRNWTCGTFTLEDDNMTPARLNWELRLALRPPNSAPSSWWTREYLPDTTIKPVRGSSLFCEHIAGKNRSV